MYGPIQRYYRIISNYDERVRLMPTLNIMPYPKQILFFSATARHIAYGGARGGGKSWAARTKAVLLALNHSGIQIIILRRTLMELRENHVLPLLSQLDGIAKYNAEAKEFVFTNKSRIKLGYCSAESDVLQYQGQAYDVIFLEEATQFTEFQKDTLTETNRSSGMMECRFTPRMYYTANPGGVGHTWFKRLFIDKSYRNAEKPEHYTFIPSTVYENEFLMTNNPEYVENLENLPEMRKRAMLYGDWDAFEGQYFSEFDRNIHVMDPFVVPNTWSRYVSIDYGLDMFAAIFVAVSPQNKAIIYREIYQQGLIVSEAADLLKKSIGKEKIELIYAPPDLWNRRNDTGRNAADIFQQSGVFLYRSKNERVLGWYAVKEWLKIIDSKDEQTGEVIKVSNLQIFKNCLNLIRCLPQLQFADRDPNDVANEPHELTHICDSLRGFCIMRVKPIRQPLTERQEKEEQKYNTMIDNMTGGEMPDFSKW